MTKNEDKGYLVEIRKTIYLGYFRQFCHLYSSLTDKQRLRNIFNNTPNKVKTIINMFQNELKVILTEEEATYMLELIQAYLNKSSFRKKVDDFEKNKLLEKQNHNCAICSCHIDSDAHFDHIIPFKYVGDELENNYQLLCSHCNHVKNVNIDFRIRYLMKTI